MPEVGSPNTVHSADELRDRILSLRARAEVRNRWLKERLEILLPKLMKEEGFDMWIVVAREYNEDPVMMSMLPDPQLSARRKTILLFTTREDGSVERFILTRFGIGDFYKSAWDPDKEEQYSCLARLVKERNPKSIGINTSKTWSFGDGLTHAEYLQIVDALETEYVNHLRSAERLCVRWLETRIQPEIISYPGVVEITHAIIADAFSSRVIHPGVTTTDDVAWWMRQKMHDLGIQAWFPPTIDRQNGEGIKGNVIVPGDLIHCDVGFYYLGLATDVQRNLYIRKPGEEEVPPGILAALRDGNRLQDIHTEEMKLGRTGNEILKSIIDRAKVEGITPSVYTHPIGVHGHAAGPIIGLWDRQQGVSGTGEYELHNDTCYAIELNVKKPAPEWGGAEVKMLLEEDAIFTNGSLRWLNGKQTKLYLI
jgi:hypothetical protein